MKISLTTTNQLLTKKRLVFLLMNFSGAFGPIELVAAGGDPTEQFAGSYRIDIFPQPDKTLRFALTNKTSMESFLYGVGPEYEREGFVCGGNMQQTHLWTEPVEFP